MFVGKDRSVSSVRCFVSSEKNDGAEKVGQAGTNGKSKGCICFVRKMETCGECASDRRYLYNGSDSRAVKANKAVKKEYTDKKEKLETDISCLESMRRISKSLSEMDSRKSKQISMELVEKRSELQSVNEELASAIEKAEDAAVLLDRIKKFVLSFRLFAPTIEEYANQVESDKTIEAGNSFRGILNELGKLLEAFKELIKEGMCWFPRLMRWKTSKGEVAPVFLEKSAGYSYSLYGYMNVETKEYYFKESVQWEISVGNRTGIVEQMDVNVEAMARDLREILRIGAEQKRLWEVYEGR